MVGKVRIGHVYELNWDSTCTVNYVAARKRAGEQEGGGALRNSFYSVRMTAAFPARTKSDLFATRPISASAPCPFVATSLLSPVAVTVVMEHRVGPGRALGGYRGESI